LTKYDKINCKGSAWVGYLLLAEPALYIQLPPHNGRLQFLMIEAKEIYIKVYFCLASRVSVLLHEYNSVYLRY